MSLTDYKNRHIGETIWILGSGGSLNFLNPHFFDDKICMAVNYSGKIFKIKEPHYIVMLDADEDDDDLRGSTHSDNNIKFLMYHTFKKHRNQKNTILFNTEFDQYYKNFDPNKHWPKNDNNIVLGNTSLHSAIHIAAYMGAKFIVLVGTDCGKLNGSYRINNYVTNTNPITGKINYGDEIYDVWDNSLIAMKKKIYNMYGCNIYSLNPFVNYNLEGTSFRGNNVFINMKYTDIFIIKYKLYQRRYKLLGLLLIIVLFYSYQIFST